MIYLGIGSNLPSIYGNRIDNLEYAISELKKLKKIATLHSRLTMVLLIQPKKSIPFSIHIKQLFMSFQDGFLQILNLLKMNGI